MVQTHGAPFVAMPTYDPQTLMIKNFKGTIGDPPRQITETDVRECLMANPMRGVWACNQNGRRNNQTGQTDVIEGQYFVNFINADLADIALAAWNTSGFFGPGIELDVQRKTLRPGQVPTFPTKTDTLHWRERVACWNARLATVPEFIPQDSMAAASNFVPRSSVATARDFGFRSRFARPQREHQSAGFKPGALPTNYRCLAMEGKWSQLEPGALPANDRCVGITLSSPPSRPPGTGHATLRGIELHLIYGAHSSDRVLVCVRLVWLPSRLADGCATLRHRDLSKF